jgi:hypothetical protein
VDPHWFQSGSGSSFLSQCGSRFGSGSREPTSADPDTDQDHNQTLMSQKAEFLHEKYTLRGNRSKTYVRRDKRRKGRKPGLLVNFGLLHCSWIWIRITISSTDPDSGQPNQCRSMRIRIQIHNTARSTTLLWIHNTARSTTLLWIHNTARSTTLL